MVNHGYIHIIYPLVMTNIAMVYMAHRNRWFTVLKNGGSFHGELLNNQMVSQKTMDLDLGIFYMI